MNVDHVSPRQRQFVTEYLRTGNGSEAVRRAGYKVKNNATAAVIASVNLRKPHVAKLVAKSVARAEITEEWLLLRIRELAEDGHPAPIRLRSLELLAKYLQLGSAKASPRHISISFGPPHPISGKGVDVEA